MNSSDPPLTGLRVLDLSRVLAGPYCTMMLADLGADVIKVEQPGAGDETRGWGPPFAGADAAYFIAGNRSKRSVALDLRDPTDHEVALALVTRSDVVIQNFRPGTIERLGLGYEDVRALAPGIVYCSLTGFGSDREPADRPGYDFIGQAESGLMHITGTDEPTKVGVAVVDILAGMNASVAILAALRRRDQTGEGEHIEISLLDSGLAALINVAQAALLTGDEARRYGNAHPHIVPYQTFQASDGWIAVAAANDGLYRRLCSAIGLQELADDERFRTNADRVLHRDELVSLVAQRLSQRPTDEWVELLGAAGVPVGKVRGVLEAFAAAQAAGRAATMAVSHPAAGEIPLVASPIRLTEASLRAGEPPPLLGEHNAQFDAILGRAPGIDDAPRAAS
ncbi:MAG: CoA transferase [Solirubrobacterales bacterium]|nr:CoA transferase [Solirubrobacterales bacterium]